MFDHIEYQQAMEAIIERFKSEMQKVRTGRAHPDMLGSVKVEAYGQYMPLNQVANVTAGDATMLLITPFDPSTIQAIASAIRADQTLGLNPADDGRVVRVPVPPLTEERRKEIVKSASAKVEEAKVALRKVRDDARKELKELEQADANNESRRINKDIIKTVRTKIEELLPKAINEVLNDAFDLQEKRKREKEEQEQKLEQAITDKRKAIQDVYAIMTEAKSNLQKNVDSLINYNSIVADICNNSGKSESQRLDEIKAKRQALSEAIEFIRNNIALINNSIDLISTIDPVVNSKQE